MNAKEQLIKTVCSEIRGHLQREKDRIYEKMKQYPTPIAGCDQQFNHLLERRTAVSREWTRLNNAERACLGAEDPMRVLAAFVKSSSCLDTETKTALTRYADDCYNGFFPQRDDLETAVTTLA